MEAGEKLREAKILFASGQLEQSVEAFKTAEKYGCNVIDVCLSKGAAQMALGRYEQAKEDFTRVLLNDPENERAYYFRGIAQVALGNYQQSVSDLTESLRRNNNRGIAHLARGLAYGELGEETLAALDLNSAEAFSEAELQSFKKLFEDLPSPFRNTKAFLSEENAPWNNLLSEKSTSMFLKLLQ